MIRSRFPRRVADRRGGGNRPTGTGPAEAGPTRPAIEGAAARHDKSRTNADFLVCRQTGFHARPQLFVAAQRSCIRWKGRSTCPRLSGSACTLLRHVAVLGPKETVRRGPKKAPRPRAASRTDKRGVNPRYVLLEDGYCRQKSCLRSVGATLGATWKGRPPKLNMFCSVFATLR